MSIVDKAWKILTKVGPFKELDDFVQKLRPTFEEYEDLSKEEARAKKAEIKKKMLERIKSDKETFGEALAEGADYVLENQSSIEKEREVVVERYDQYGAEAFLDKEQPEGGKKPEQTSRQRQQELTEEME